MAPMILVDNEYMTLQYLPDKKIIYHTIHKPVGGETLRNALNIGTAALAEHGAGKWLSDDRLNGPLSEEDREWGMTNWNQRAIAAGWRYWALVVPKAAYDAGTMLPTIDALYLLGLRMMVFTELEEAFAWLDSQEGASTKPSLVQEEV